MYLVSIPVNCYKFHRAKDKQPILDELRAFDADRVMLNFEAKLDGALAFHNEEKYRTQLSYLHEACVFFKRHGFEVGAWFWGLQFDRSLDFVTMKTLSGSPVQNFACPTDERYLEAFQRCLKDVAGTGVDMILLNDDLRFGAWSGFGCLCENHVKMICEQLGENVDETLLRELILSGGKNRYRDAFLNANKRSLQNYAVKMRRAVDEVNPKLRLGFCACMSSWDIDGDAFEIAKLLAGNTKPVLRLIGAPYWVACSGKDGLQDVVELERMEASWNRDSEIEQIAEGDAYPRPRLNCPASYLEGFDTALRASGALDGILKICMDYVSNVGYEDGYCKQYLKNKPVYRDIEKHFSGKKSCGIRVYEFMHKAARMQFPNALGSASDMEQAFYPSAARVLSAGAIPTVYEGFGVTGIAFGENACQLTEENFKNGMILDALAAKILTDRGVDVGIDAFGAEISAKYQYFCAEDNYVIVDEGRIYDAKLKAGCKILSYAANDFEKTETPLSYLYQNGSGQKFLVFCCDGKESERLLKNYGNEKAIAEHVEWLSGNRLPAVCYGNPNLYLQCKEDEDYLVVGIWNFFEDEAISPVIHLAREYKSAEFLCGSGTLCADRAILEDIPPYAFRGIVLKN